MALPAWYFDVDPAGASRLRRAATAGANPFIGTWANTDNDAITIRTDTVVVNQPNRQSTALGDAVCGGVFSFNYSSRSKDTLIALVPRQPGLGDFV